MFQSKRDNKTSSQHNTNFNNVYEKLKMLFLILQDVKLLEYWNQLLVLIFLGSLPSSTLLRIHMWVVLLLMIFYQRCIDLFKLSSQVNCRILLKMSSMNGQIQQFNRDNLQFLIEVEEEVKEDVILVVQLRFWSQRLFWWQLRDFEQGGSFNGVGEFGLSGWSGDKGGDFCRDGNRRAKIRTCYNCGEVGNTRNKCPKLYVKPSKLVSSCGSYFRRIGFHRS